MGKREELEMEVRRREIDIIGITESWMHDGIEDREVNMEGFTLFRRDRGRGDKKRGGGVLLYVSNDLDAVRVGECTVRKSETLWVKIKDLGGDYINVGVCYRSPTASMEEEEDLVKEISENCRRRALVLGDFNYGDINWETLQAENGSSRKFMEIISDLFLTQHVKEGTRGERILDVVLSTGQDMVEDLKVRGPIANSDHNVLVFKLVCESERVISLEKTYNYHKGDYKKICRELGGIDWEERFRNEKIEDMWCILLEEIKRSREKYVPVRGIRKEDNLKERSMKVRNMVETKRKRWKKFKEEPTRIREMKYLEIRRKVTAAIRSEKRGQEEKIADRIKEDPKSFYAYVRGRSKTKPRIGPLEGEGGVLVADNEGMANILNEFYATVFTKERLSNMPVASEEALGGREVGLQDIEVKEEDILEAVGKLQENKAAGVDGVNSTFLKGIIGGVVKPLAILFRETMNRGEMPGDWKKANVVAIFKKGTKKDPGNYRPVSITCQIGKMMERVIKSQIVEYLEGNGIIYDSQHGFRGRRSCLTNLLEFMELVSRRLDEGEPVDVVFLDFQKAFDKVPHKRLMLKLRAMGIGGKLWAWIESWLSNRRQRVVIGGVCSEWREVESGVPQGSVLGPLLFVMYINDIDEGLVNRIMKFADDTKVVGRVSNQEEVDGLQRDLGRLGEWSKQWLMPFNVGKCKVMHMGGNNREEILELEGVALEVVEVERDLGVALSRDMKVAVQCGRAASKGYQVLGMIGRTFTSKKCNIVVKLYKSLVRPHLEYCIQAWRPHLLKDREVLERVQRRATRMMEECRGREYEDRLRIAGLTSLEERRRRADMVEVYKIMNGLENIEERKFVERSKEGSSRETRGHAMKLYKRGVRTDSAKYSFGNRVMVEWNRLPSSVVESGSLGSFKGRLDKFMGRVGGV